MTATRTAPAIDPATTTARLHRLGRGACRARPPPRQRSCTARRAPSAAPAAGRLDRNAPHRRVPQQVGEVDQHAGGGAPDVIVAPGEDVEVARRAREDRGCARWRFAGSRTKASGTSKTSATSNGSGVSAIGGVDEADDRRHLEAGARDVGVEPADQLDAARGSPTSSSASRSAAASASASPGSMRPPGKLIWPAWSLQMVGAPRQQHGQALRPLDQRHQHRRRASADGSGSRSGLRSWSPRAPGPAAPGGRPGAARRRSIPASAAVSGLVRAARAERTARCSIRR